MTMIFDRSVMLMTMIFNCNMMVMVMVCDRSIMVICSTGGTTNGESSAQGSCVVIQLENRQTLNINFQIA